MSIRRFLADPNSGFFLKNGGLYFEGAHHCVYLGMYVVFDNAVPYWSRYGVFPYHIEFWKSLWRDCRGTDDRLDAWILSGLLGTR